MFCPILLGTVLFYLLPNSVIYHLVEYFQLSRNFILNYMLSFLLLNKYRNNKIAILSFILLSLLTKVLLSFLQSGKILNQLNMRYCILPLRISLIVRFYTPNMEKNNIIKILMKYFPNLNQYQWNQFRFKVNLFF